ncbi:MAG: hypothetical protein ACREVI_16990 [Steroidobacteraceae bacterium]
MKMRTHSLSAFVCFLVFEFSITTSATAEIKYNSNAYLETSHTSTEVRLEAITSSTSPTDHYAISSIAARGDPFVGPGYHEVGPWGVTPLIPNKLAWAVADLKVSDPAPSTHCANGRHKWTMRSNVTHILPSLQKCVTVSGGGGGGGGCSVPYPVTSVLSLDGRSSAIPGAERSALTRIGAAEDGRTIIVDEFAIVDLASWRLLPNAMSEAFEFPVIPSNELAKLSEISSVRAFERESSVVH